MSFNLIIYVIEALHFIIPIQPSPHPIFLDSTVMTPFQSSRPHVESMHSSILC
jgi:hypothetical protein